MKRMIRQTDVATMPSSFLLVFRRVTSQGNEDGEEENGRTGWRQI